MTYYPSGYGEEMQIEIDTLRAQLVEAPAEPPTPEPDDEVCTDGYCTTCGAIALMGANYCENHIPPAPAPPNVVTPEPPPFTSVTQQCGCVLGIHRARLKTCPKHVSLPASEARPTTEDYLANPFLVLSNSPTMGTDLSPSPPPAPPGSVLVSREDAERWQPIESAPEARYVLIYLPNYGCLRGIKTTVHGIATWWADSRVSYPTHWMPMPPPPGLPVEGQS